MFNKPSTYKPKVYDASQKALLLSLDGEKVLEYLSNACRDYEMNDWRDREQRSFTVEEGRLLLRACAQDSDVLQHCVRQIAIALKITDYYQYPLLKKYYPESFGRSIIVTIDDAKFPFGIQDSYLPYINQCEEAIYCCHLFDRIYHHGLSNGSLKEEFQTQCHAIFTDVAADQTMEHAIRDLYKQIPLPSNLLLPDIEIDIETVETARPIMPPVSSAVIYPNWDDLKEPINHGLAHSDTEDLLSYLAMAYFQYERNGWAKPKYRVAYDIENGYSLIKGCAQDIHILERCFQAMTEDLLIYDARDYQFQKYFYKEGSKNRMIVIDDEAMFRHTQENFSYLEPCREAFYACCLFEQMVADTSQKSAITTAFKQNLQIYFQIDDHIKAMSASPSMFLWAQSMLKQIKPTLVHNAADLSRTFKEPVNGVTMTQLKGSFNTVHMSAALCLQLFFWIKQEIKPYQLDGVSDQNTIDDLQSTLGLSLVFYVCMMGLQKEIPLQHSQDVDGFDDEEQQSNRSRLQIKR